MYGMQATSCSGHRWSRGVEKTPSHATHEAAQCAPRRRGRYGTEAAEAKKDPSQGVDVLRNRANMCGSPAGTANRPGRERRLKFPPHRVLTDAKVALQCAAHPDGNNGVAGRRR